MRADGICTTSRAATSPLQMDFYEDNHVLKTPQQVMVVQLAAGDTPPFAEAATPGQKAADPFRIDMDGIQKRTFPLPVPAGNYLLPPGRQRQSRLVLGAAIHRR